MVVELKKTDARFKGYSDGFCYYLDFKRNPEKFTKHMRVFSKLFGSSVSYTYYEYFPPKKWLYCSRKERIYFKERKMLTLVQLKLN